MRRDTGNNARMLGFSLPVATGILHFFDSASRASSGTIDKTEYPAWWIRFARSAFLPLLTR